MARLLNVKETSFEFGCKCEVSSNCFHTACLHVRIVARQMICRYILISWKEFDFLIEFLQAHGPAIKLGILKASCG